MNLFRKNLDSKSKEILSIIGISDKLTSIYEQFRNIQEDNIPINGFVTVIVNEGKPNQRIIQTDLYNLLTILGRDFFHKQCYTNVGVGTRGSNFIGLSDNATDPVAGDDALAGEITANGLERALATISHTLGTNITTLENVFTAGIVFTNVHKAALFNEATKDTPPPGGTDQMTHADKFTADVDLQIGDTVTVTWTLTLG